MVYTLSVPNLEVRTTYTRIIGRYFSTKIENEKLQAMLKALLEGDKKLAIVFKGKEVTVKEG
ncbi:MAG: hypothetical protein JSV88_09500 [Candidatus Aminicenantes bacterium]|nr:MAG: hypothetical protein JSV88_09500 [Candidatus Aminicenantes bacterium]